MPKIYSPVDTHSCDYGVDFINGAGALASGSSTEWFERKGYYVEPGKHDLTVMDKLPLATLKEIVTELEITLPEEGETLTLTKRDYVEALNTCFASATADDFSEITVTYANGNESASGTAPTQTAVTLGAEITVKDNTFTLTGKVFAGWKDDNGVIWVKNNKIRAGAINITLTAQWVDAT